MNCNKCGKCVLPNAVFHHCDHGLEIERLQRQCDDAKLFRDNVKTEVEAVIEYISRFATGMKRLLSDIEAAEKEYLVEELKPLFWRLNRIIKAAEQKNAKCNQCGTTQGDGNDEHNSTISGRI